MLYIRKLGEVAGATIAERTLRKLVRQLVFPDIKLYLNKNQNGTLKQFVVHDVSIRDKVLIVPDVTKQKLTISAVIDTLKFNGTARTRRVMMLFKEPVTLEVQKSKIDVTISINDGKLSLDCNMDIMSVSWDMKDVHIMWDTVKKNHENMPPFAKELKSQVE